MGISITKRNYLLQSAFLTLIVGGIGAFLYHAFAPQQYFSIYPVISLFFFLVGWITIGLVEKCRSFSPNRVLQAYLLVKVVRMLLTVLFIVIYCVILRDGILPFVLAFVVNYLIYLVYDSWFFFTSELKLKKKK